MCLANMANESGNYSSKDGFLKSANVKLVANKRKAEPDMRVEALLGCTCKRIRREIEDEKTQIFSREDTFNEQLESSESTCCNKAVCLNETYVNLHENFMDLLNDPQQVEDFLRHVENQQLNLTNVDRDSDSTCKNDNCSLDKDQNCSFTNPDELVVEDLMESYKVDSFCADFDTLYTELVESLVSVEKWMNLAATCYDKMRTDSAVSLIDEDSNCSNVLNESFTSFATETTS